MVCNNLSRLWAVVDFDSNAVLFASFYYSLSQSFRDRLWQSFEDSLRDFADSADVAEEIERRDWTRRYQLVRYDINRAYSSPSPTRAALVAFRESLLGG